MSHEFLANAGPIILLIPAVVTGAMLIYRVLPFRLVRTEGRDLTR